MTRAGVTTLLPSLAISSRIAAIGEIIGTFDQDRATGMYGTLGTGPSMIPITVDLSDDKRGINELFEFEVLIHDVFTPILTYTGVLNTFFSWNRAIGANTYEVTSVTQIQDMDPVTNRNVYTGPTAGISAAIAAAMPVTTLLANTFEPVIVDRIDISVRAHEQSKLATLQRIWVNDQSPTPGDTIQLNIATRTSSGMDHIETIELELPRHITGPLELLVSDATSLQQREVTSGRQIDDARSLPQLIHALNTTRQNDRLYVQLLNPVAGAVVSGTRLASLPPSVLAVIEGDRDNGEVVRLNQATLSEWTIQTDNVISGTRLLTLNVETE